MILFLVSSCVFAAGDFPSAGGRAAGMGSAAVAVSDPWSVFNNQAGVAGVRKITAGIFFGNGFLVKELGIRSIGAILPVKAGGFGLSFQYFGYSLYNEIKGGVCFARNFGKYFSVGVQLDYFRIHIAEDLGNRNLFTFEIGMQYRVTDNLCLGVHFFNPVPVNIIPDPVEKLPVIINLGLSWKFASNFLGAVEVEKNMRERPVLKAGLEYNLVKPFFLRIGIVTGPTMFTFGFGFEFGSLKFDLASSWHPVLGYSPQGSLVYSFK
jgi:hypothetical protein